jgi:sensor domain CHASE-containing protein
MEMNKVSISIISVLVTLAIALGSFSYKTGSYSNEIKNLKEQQTIIKTDLTNEMHRIENRKADADIVNIIFKKIDSMEQKLDKLISQKIGD